MDFPKDQKIPPEEMVRTYEETCAKGLNIRLVYFRVALGLKELPGVVFVLPDSYIDPQNKEYGGIFFFLIFLFFSFFFFGEL
ncbi:hypothetical protein FEM48_Zijuj08G0168900 [Ziziphus jujuba var. spinosa]|uniref:MORF/ORRM1/DAG-like MORF domain-containing protein n=1 Tax=Ziziphus jujuba var. spinosa TaxID=714518 RepID=A0A978V095_ZIZJJ|nr:hypothetical protein FEM48_Zijuj08G0168900 [Ziziphus jujuba var. spinosa]